jgi:7-carboxy-7-deazaguanine synthase (Cx14CxxC type)
MSYAIKEIFYTLQGEGANAGRPAVFCRFAGCNLWSGREEDRATAVCQFCDTDFVGMDGVGGGRFATAAALAESIVAHWPRDVGNDKPFIVLTGGEPLLQIDADLIDALHGFGCILAVETNGTVAAPPGLDWICVSPKAGSELVLRAGDELKLIYPQAGIDPADLLGLPFRNFFLQAKDDPNRAANTAGCIQYILDHPHWRLSVQTHKALGFP